MNLIQRIATLRLCGVSHLFPVQAALGLDVKHKHVASFCPCDAFLLLNMLRAKEQYVARL